jgi:hypothetical protein
MLVKTMIVLKDIPLRWAHHIDAGLAGGESRVIVFNASTDGVFQYFSKHNMPQMTGQQIVLPK